MFFTGVYLSTGVGGGYLWSHVLSGDGWVSLVPGSFRGNGYVLGTHPFRGMRPRGGYVQMGAYPPPPQEMGYNRICSASEQYASYWNAC